jgi:hypothetical protein
MASGAQNDDYRPVHEDDVLETAVMNDIVRGLADEFVDAGNEFLILQDARFDQPLANDAAQTFVWRWWARPTPALVGEIEVDPVEIDGATIVTADGQMFQRFIDWEGALSELGIIGPVRIPNPD